MAQVTLAEAEAWFSANGAKLSVGREVATISIRGHEVHYSLAEARDTAFPRAIAELKEKLG